jgi:hypothetical protein
MGSLLKEGGRLVIWIGKTGAGTSVGKAALAAAGTIATAVGLGYWLGKKKK